MSAVIADQPGTPPGGFVAGLGRRATSGGMVSQVLVPVTAVLAALLVGGVLIALDGVNPLSDRKSVV